MSDKFKFSERQAQKRASREADAKRLAAGEVSAAELSRQNSFVKGGGFAGKKIGFSARCRPENGDRWYSPDGRVGKADGSVEWLHENAGEFDK